MHIYEFKTLKISFFPLSFRFFVGLLPQDFRNWSGKNEEITRKTESFLEKNRNPLSFAPSLDVIISALTEIFEKADSSGNGKISIQVNFHLSLLFMLANDT